MNLWGNPTFRTAVYLLALTVLGAIAGAVATLATAESADARLIEVD